MKIIYYFIFCIEKLCSFLGKGFEFAFSFFSYFEKKVKSLRRNFGYRILHHQRNAGKLRPQKKDLKENTEMQRITMQIKTSGIVGKTKTEFLKESDLPQFKKNEVIHSIPLEMELTTDSQEEPDIDPADVEVEEYDDSIRNILEEENENPDLYDDAPYVDDLSNASGVTMEELGETFEVLKKDKCSDEEKDKARLVLKKIEDTDFIRFFLLQRESMEKAKIFMEEIDSNKGDSTIASDFNINRYV